MDAKDQMIINALQDGFMISERPYMEEAAELGLTEWELIERLQCMLEVGYLSRFGPMYHAEKLGGGLTLAAMAVPETVFEQVAEMVNGYPEVAHNYQRDHQLNMWFVLATERPERIDEVIAEIEQASGYPVYNMPKQEEFFVGLRFQL